MTNPKMYLELNKLEEIFTNLSYITFNSASLDEEGNVIAYYNLDSGEVLKVVIEYNDVIFDIEDMYSETALEIEKTLLYYFYSEDLNEMYNTHNHLMIREAEDDRAIFANKIIKGFYSGDLERDVEKWNDLSNYMHEYVRNFYEIENEVPLETYVNITTQPFDTSRQHKAYLKYIEYKIKEFYS